MRRWLILAALAIAAVAAVSVFGGDSARGDDDHSSPRWRAVAVDGTTKVQGHDAVVHVLVAVEQGEDAIAKGNSVLEGMGARPLHDDEKQKARGLESANYVTTGMVWNQFLDSNPGNDFVVQYYNPTGGPSGGYEALKRSQNTWTNVATSSFTFKDGGTTSRCPSLVQECPGDQRFDGFNDVGWLALPQPSVLGVTWYATSGPDEADMVLNTRFSWYTGTGTPGSGQYDAESVILHENGHVLGLSHSPITGAVMYAYYNGRRTLHSDDINGISTLYPSSGSSSSSPTPTPTVTPSSGSGTMHVGDIDSARARISSTRWLARATVYIHTSSHGAVSGATVTGQWKYPSGNVLGTTTGTTGSSGSLTFGLSQISNAYSYLDFCITRVTHASLTYAAASNHDLDGSSNGTCIRINRP